MQTNFSKEQLANPDFAEADRILRKCVHCGLCTAVCSTYVLLGDERDSPRGRIYLIKDMLENEREASAEIQLHVDRCLSCLSCMTTCPSGVDYKHLVDIARGHIAKTEKRTFRERMARTMLTGIIPYPNRFRVALKAASLAKPLKGLLRRFGFYEVAEMIDLAPRDLPPSAKYSGPGTAATDMTRRASVILLAGCAQQVLRPDINDATIRLLARRGVDVVVSHGSGCCGALVHHMGKEEEALQQVRKNVDAWRKQMGKQDIDAIIINASGCGTMVKDYGYLLRNDPDYRDAAKHISEMTLDITEFLSRFELGPPKRYSSLRVAYHSACSLQHGQGVHDEPKELLRKAGYSVADVPEGHICCGSAGVYNVLQPELANELRLRKVRNLRHARADLVAAGNIGCISQLESHLDIPIAHTVELLDWAFGGPVPRGLEALEQFVSEVPQPRRYVPDDFLEA